MIRWTSLSSVSVAGMLALVTLTTPAARAQDVPQPMAGNALSEQHQIIKNKVTSTKLKLDNWKREWWTLAFLTFLVGALGGTVAALQRCKKGWADAATVVMGLAIALITAATAAFFPSDCRAIKKRIAVTEATLEDIQYKLALYNDLPTWQEKRDLLSELQQLFKPINEFEEASLPTFTLLDVLPVLHAQKEPQPPWVTSAPADDVNVYFVGVADGPLLKEAKEKSLNDALTKAEVSLSRGLRVYNEEALRDYARNRGDAAAVSFTYDRATRRYRYFTLFKMNREFIEGAFVSGAAARSPWREPAALAALASGEIVVLDRFRGVFLVPSGAGKVRRLTPEFGLAPASDLAVARLDGRDYVFFTSIAKAMGEARVTQLAVAGGNVAQWTIPLQLASFVSVAVDPEARLGYVSYVNKEGRAGIYKLDVRRPGAPPIPFTTIRGSSRLGAIALDPKRRRLLVADAVGGSVYAVDLAKGNPLTFARKVGKVAALAVDVNKERLLVAEATRGQILAFGLDSPSDRRGVPLPFKGSQGLRGLTIDTRGTLWVADMDKGTVAQLAMDGSQMATLGP